MKTEQIISVYFSATNTTKKVVEAISEGLNIAQKKTYNLCIEKEIPQIKMTDKDLLILGMPSYSGRVPTVVLDRLNQIKGNQTPAILACAYGNREYEDTLLEMKNIAEANGFKVISAGAFIAQHSIFPKVAVGRPNAEDLLFAKKLGNDTTKILENIESVNELPDISLSGNFPYRTTKPIPLKPTGNKKCTDCGACAKQCPVQAINKATPRKTDGDKCINCGRCINICPVNARDYLGLHGLLYKIAQNKFVKNNSARKENEIVFAEK